MNPQPRPRLRHPHEIPVFVFCVLLNLVIAVLLIVEASADLVGGAVGRWLAVGILLLFPLLAASQYLLRGAVRSSTVRTSPGQFPELYSMKSELARRLGYRPGTEPDLYVQAGNGVLNAFAANALRQGFTVVHSDLFANTLRDNEAALRFIIGHELGHIRCHHTRLWYRMATCFIAYLPLVGAWLSRLRELTCDRHGAFVAPDGVAGLVLLSAGRYVYRDVRLAELLAQARWSRHSVWSWLAQLPRSHPFTLRRVAALYDLGMFMPIPDPQATVATSQAPAFASRALPS